MTAVAPQAGVPANPALNGARFSFVGQLRSEWLKLFAVRSTWWVLGVAIVAMVGVSALGSLGMKAMADYAGSNGLPSGSAIGVAAVGSSYGMAQMVFVILGALVITGEYSTGRIRAVLSAAPTRLPVLAAKALLLTVVAFVVGLLGVTLSWLAASLILPSSLAPSLDADGAWTVILGIPAYLAVMALISLGLGTVIRATAGAIAAGIGLILLPLILSAIQVKWLQDILQYFPGPAGDTFLAGGSDNLGQWAALAVFLAWAVLALAGGGLLLKNRDA